jgi:hypothetical protein
VKKKRKKIQINTGETGHVKKPTTIKRGKRNKYILRLRIKTITGVDHE